MAKHLRAQTEIDADAERVWQVLTDFGAYAPVHHRSRRCRGRR